MIEGMTLFHGTSSVNVDSIMQNGILPSEEYGNEPKGVFLTTDYVSARTYALLTTYGFYVDKDEVVKGKGGKPVVLKCHVPDGLTEKYDEDVFVSPDTVAPSMIVKRMNCKLWKADFKLIDFAVDR